MDKWAYSREQSKTSTGGLLGHSDVSFNRKLNMPLMDPSRSPDLSRRSRGVSFSHPIDHSRPKFLDTLKKYISRELSIVKAAK